MEEQSPAGTPALSSPTSTEHSSLPSLAPVTSVPSPSEQAAIDAELASRRRHKRFSFHHARHASSSSQRDSFHRPSGTDAALAAGPSDAVVAQVDAGAAAERELGRGVAAQMEQEPDRLSEAGDVEDEAEWQDRPLEHAKTHDLEAYRQSLRPPINVTARGKEVDFDASGPTPKQEYVWDVMFENQRGSLLPSDPSPFTVPSRPIRGASSLTISGPQRANGGERQETDNVTDDDDARLDEADDPSTAGPSAPSTSRSRRWVARSHMAKIDSRPPNTHRSIRTTYTLETAQPPSPAWTWLTPWLVNMREGTDEGGWRYNWVFKRGGWKPCAGPAGWGGWCRRREWVRLRCVKVEAPVDGARRGQPAEDEAGEGRHGSRKMLDLDADDDEIARRILATMVRLRVDKDRLDRWGKWLEGLPDDRVGKLQRVLDAHGVSGSPSSQPDDQAEVARSFTYSISLQPFKALLQSRSLRLPDVRPF